MFIFVTKLNIKLYLSNTAQQLPFGLWKNLCFVAVFSKNVINSTIPGNTMNTKYFSCVYQLQYNVVFIGKFNLVTYHNLLGGKPIKFAFILSFPIWDIYKKLKYKSLIISKSKFLKKTQLKKFKCFTTAPTLKNILPAAIFKIDFLTIHRVPDKQT